MVESDSPYNAEHLPTVAIIGTDAFLAALPGTPAQLTRACVAAGFGAAVPACWGDELLAAETLREVARRGDEPSVLCACPRVASRLRSASGDAESAIARACIPLVAPPVATARYVRGLYGRGGVRITYAGECPGAADPSIDARLSPAALLRLLDERGVTPGRHAADAQPAPGHRRFRSLPGGAPAAAALWEAGGRQLVELDGVEPVAELTRRLRASERALFDLAPGAGCVCSGAVAHAAPHSARAAVAAMEPPRARGEVLDPSVQVNVEIAPRPERRDHGDRGDLGHDELHEGARGGRGTGKERGSGSGTPGAGDAGGTSPSGAPTRRRSRTSGIMRAIGGHLPVRKAGEGRSLPRAYIARRTRLPSGSLFAVADPATTGGEREVRPPVAALADAPSSERRSPFSITVPLPVKEPYRVPPPPSPGVRRSRVAMTLGVLLIVMAVLVYLAVR
ncbi:MAG: hypothetical protein WKG32_14130 [Gemmatimonadaceae bacterium]